MRRKVSSTAGSGSVSGVMRSSPALLTSTSIRPIEARAGRTAAASVMSQDRGDTSRRSRRPPSRRPPRRLGRSRACRPRRRRRRNRAQRLGQYHGWHQSPALFLARKVEAQRCHVSSPVSACRRRGAAPTGVPRRLASPRVGVPREAVSAISLRTRRRARPGRLRSFSVRRGIPYAPPLR